MFGLGPTEMIIGLVVVLLLFGAKRIPEIAGSFGKGIKEFKKGDPVKAVVLDVDSQKERISLGIKQVGGDPIESRGVEAGGTWLQFHEIPLCRPWWS